MGAPRGKSLDDPTRPTPQRRDPRNEREDRQTPRILIVEDEYLVAVQIETALSEAGFAIAGIAARADEAVRLARETRPDLIVMDIRLAGPRDGIDAAIDIYKTTGIRCIFATAHSEPALQQRARAAAPLGWLGKPYQMSALTALIRAALRPE